ncbi:MAG TPA: hypothetical protein VK760_04445 [Candidatus Acidoferrales bacterium]|jgi:hypothetical protein|nr:hypothetical protein [Candidatus Acidoferrales bacterium]
MQSKTLAYQFPWKTGATPGTETMSLCDGLIQGTIRADSGDATYTRCRARFEPFELGVFETRELAKAAVEQKATALINGLLATVLPPELKAWLHQT